MPATKHQDELDKYFKADLEEVDDVIGWWQQHRGWYPQLSRMAMDYLSIPGK